ncbi:oligosaccharide MFS transporter [Novosphingobium guangzhouense]|uniref:Galactoside permease n=1 Tax=Novosphingobium guangzhouense TaxID=1850347 RepID=A0A2K2FWV7_9SPHN|nr:oligosaccharide MFS transporter [Novosphingobium guangzhouense]PNU03271.1 galactoside permease [Novosphingobium guangzhouense]
MLANRQRNYAVLSAFLFAFFFAQAMAMSLLSIWLTRSLHLNGAQAGTVFAVNSIGAMLAQPAYGFLSDRMGFRKVVPVMIAALVILAGPFFLYVYAPLLRWSLPVGAVTGGIYLGFTFMAGSYALESYVDRVGRRYGFEYSRTRLWGSIGFATAAAFSGRLYNLDPTINFFLASIAGLALIPLIRLARIEPDEEAQHAADQLKLRETLALFGQARFWRFMILILGVTNLYLVYDQQFPFYFSSLFPTPEEGNAMFGYLNAAQIFVEAGGMFVAPLIVRRIGATRGLLLAAMIMIIRIAGSGFAIGPVTISMCKMAHAVELPILAVSIFRYIAYHFESRFASTVYMVGVSFGHSLGLAILSPLAGIGYDLFGFQHTYFLIAGFALFFWIWSAISLAPTPPEYTPVPHKGGQAPDTAAIASAPDVRRYEDAL